MRIDMKNVIEIASGVAIGGLVTGAVNGIGKLAKKSVIKIREKAKEPKKD